MIGQLCLEVLVIAVVCAAWYWLPFVLLRARDVTIRRYRRDSVKRFWLAVLLAPALFGVAYWTGFGREHGLAAGLLVFAILAAGFGHYRDFLLTRQPGRAWVKGSVFD